MPTPEPAPVALAPVGHGVVIKTADQLAVGEYFVGIVELADFSHSEFVIRTPGGGRRRIIDGAKVQVTLTVHSDGTGAGDVMKMFVGLPWEHPHQLCNDSVLWVAGQRDKRSSIVSILHWSLRCPKKIA